MKSKIAKYYIGEKPGQIITISSSKNIYIKNNIEKHFNIYLWIRSPLHQRPWKPPWPRWLGLFPSSKKIFFSNFRGILLQISLVPTPTRFFKGDLKKHRLLDLFPTSSENIFWDKKHLLQASLTGQDLYLETGLHIGMREPNFVCSCLRPNCRSQVIDLSLSVLISWFVK